jgi:hypothetical protein
MSPTDSIPSRARHEGQDLGRGPVQPLRVIHHANDRPFLCCDLCQQAQHSQADQEPVRHQAIVQPKSDPKRLTLRRRQQFDPGGESPGTNPVRHIPRHGQ